jgi:hypothetical protein
MRHLIFRSFATVRHTLAALRAPALVVALSTATACSGDPTAPGSQSTGDLPWYWNITPNAITLAVGDTLTLSTVMARLDSVVSPLRAGDTVRWSTSDLRKVSVSNTGLITALEPADITSPVKISASFTEGTLTRTAEAYVMVTATRNDVARISLRTSDYHTPVRGFFEPFPFVVPRWYLSSTGDTVPPVLTYFTVNPSSTIATPEPVLGSFLFFVRGKRLIQAHAYAYGKRLYDSATYTVTGVDTTIVYVRKTQDTLRAYLSNDGGQFGNTYHNHVYMHLNGMATFQNSSPDTLTGTFVDPTFAGAENPGGPVGDFVLAPGASTVRRLIKPGIARMTLRAGTQEVAFRFETE